MTGDGENCITRNFIIYTVHRMVQYDTAEFEMDRACSVQGGDEICLHDFRRPHERDCLANVVMDVRIILRK